MYPKFVLKYGLPIISRYFDNMLDEINQYILILLGNNYYHYIEIKY
jgi:hypothetical protein